MLWHRSCSAQCGLERRSRGTSAVLRVTRLVETASVVALKWEGQIVGDC